MKALSNALFLKDFFFSTYGIKTHKFNPAYLVILLLSPLLLLSSCKDDEDDKPVEQLELTLDAVKGNAIDLSWEISKNENFESYKLYRHNTSGIDDETGTFIHVSTDKNSNTFSDEDLDGNKTYFYRLYHVVINGNKRGSNVVDGTTAPSELLENGSFESLTNGVPTPWRLIPNNESFANPNNSMIIVNDATDGDNGLKIYHDEETGCYEQWISQKLDLDDLKENTKYELTFDYKADFDLPQVWITLRNSALDLSSYEDLNYTPSQSWQPFSFEFTLPENIGSSNPELVINFCESGKHNIWLDNVSLKQAD